MIFWVSGAKLGAKIDQKPIKKWTQQGKGSEHRFLIDFCGFRKSSWEAKGWRGRTEDWFRRTHICFVKKTSYAYETEPWKPEHIKNKLQVSKLKRLACVLKVYGMSLGTFTGAIIDYWVRDVLVDPNLPPLMIGCVFLRPSQLPHTRARYRALTSAQSSRLLGTVGKHGSDASLQASTKSNLVLKIKMLSPISGVAGPGPFPRFIYLSAQFLINLQKEF